MRVCLAMALLASLAISACSTAPKVTTAQTPRQEMTTNGGKVNAAAETAPLSETVVSSTDLAAQLDGMQKNSVYFDFGSFAIKPEYREVIQQQAEFMKAHENVVVTLEGNTDERGSREYNLALGDKRANVVRKALEMMGVPDSRIKIASFGEEHPRLACHEEQCWKENRRTDFIGKTGP